MNKTLLNIIKSREDVSDYLFHFTTGNLGFDTLKEIIESDAIIDVNGRGCICLTETPITLLIDMFGIFNKYYNPMYAQYGIAIKKDYLFDLGARPVIYGTQDEENEIGEPLKWRFEEYIPNVKDFSWLREWRIKEKEIKLDRDNCFIVTKTKSELEEIIFSNRQIIDVEFDGCVADGQFWANATGIYERAFKGISFEDLIELNSLKKSELDEILKTQSLDDRAEKGLGSFLT